MKKTKTKKKKTAGPVVKWKPPRKGTSGVTRDGVRAYRPSKNPLNWFEENFQKFRRQELTKAAMIADFSGFRVYIRTRGNIKITESGGEMTLIVMRKNDVPLAAVFTEPDRSIEYSGSFPNGYDVRGLIFLECAARENWGIIINPGFWDYTISPDEVKKILKRREVGPFLKFWQRFAP